MTQTIQDVFKQFCKERHAEDKGRNHDLLQEVYASTEFFDMEFLDDTECAELTNYVHTPNNSKADFPIENFSLPFQSIFVRYDEQCHIFLREYTPDTITGTLYIPECSFKEISRGVEITGTLNCPFTIHLSNNYPTMSRPSVVIDYSWFSVDDNDEEIATSDLQVIIKVCEVLNELSHKAVAVDKPVNNYYEYYRRKRKPTLKIPQRPIYYVLGEKNEDVSVKYRYIQPKGTLEYSYAFKVRGHWRHIGDKTFGKDRNGVYGIKGYTWVIEHIRGEGELSKRLRVIK